MSGRLKIAFHNSINHRFGNTKQPKAHSEGYFIVGRSLSLIITTRALVGILYGDDVPLFSVSRNWMSTFPLKKKDLKKNNCSQLYEEKDVDQKCLNVTTTEICSKPPMTGVPSVISPRPLRLLLRPLRCFFPLL